MTVYIYNRVSQDESEYICCGQKYVTQFGKTLSCSVCGTLIDTSKPPERIQNQLSDCLRYCDAFDLPAERIQMWEVASAGSSKLRERPAGRRLLMSLKRGDHIVITKLDRMWRSVLDAARTLCEFNAQGVIFHIIDMRVDTSTAMGKFMLHLMASLAEFEIDTQSERRKVRVQHLKTAGMSTGNVPFGFKTELDTTTGQRRSRRVPDDKEREVLKELLRLHADGYNRAEMCRRLEKVGHKSRKGTSYGPAYVRKLLVLAQDWRDSGWGEEVLLRGFKGRE